MEFPNADAVASAVDPVAYPTFARVSYDPPTPTLDDVPGAARDAVSALPTGDLDPGATVAVGLGSRGITDVERVARAAIGALADRGFDPVVVPAMGSHGGATPEGQRETLASLGLTPESLGCPVDARMATASLGESGVGHEVRVARAALEADAVLVVNRVKPHTNFTGAVESGLSKMLAVGLGKQAGARAFHEAALDVGYEATIRAAVETITDALPVLGGVAVVENFREETARVAGVPAAALPDAEADLLADAREWMPTLPFEDLDVLVVDRIGKDVSGAGMDTNVIGRYEVLNADDPPTPDVDRIVVRGLTDGTHGNAAGIGLADVTTQSVLEDADLTATYTNVLTSSSLKKARLPVALPTDELALRAAVSSIGNYDPGSVRIAWIEDTSHLSSFRVSAALAEDLPEHVAVEGRAELRFADGEPVFDSL